MPMVRGVACAGKTPAHKDRKSTRLNSSHQIISYAVFCLKKKIALTTDIALLERTPYTLRTMLPVLQPVGTDANEGPETWIPYVIVGHLFFFFNNAAPPETSTLPPPDALRI